MNKKLFHGSILIAVALVLILSVGSFQAVGASHSAVSIMVMSSETAGVTTTLAKVYEEPDDSSQIINVLPPEKAVRILGFNDSASWAAIAKGNQPDLAGWIALSELKHDFMVGTTRSLVKAYQHPNTAGGIQSVIAPGIKLQVLGLSPDKAWFAVANPLSQGASVRWVSAGELKFEDVIATTATLTKLYARPDTSSPIKSVLPPAQKVVLIGQNSSGTWFSVAETNGKKFIGWAQSSDIAGGKERAILPVLPGQ